MMYIEAQNTISRQAGGQELAGGTLLPVPVEEVRGKSRKGRGKAPVQR